MAITFTLQRAAEESGLSMRTLQYAIRRGDLQSIQVGRRRLIPARALEAFLCGKTKRATQKVQRGAQ
jgi:excisionase family DNA binding protein